MDQQPQAIAGHCFDVGIIGGGWIGFSAALQLAEKGRSVLLLDSTASLVWESGRSFFPECGPCRGDGRFESFLDRATYRSGISGRYLDGAIAELLAAERLKEAGVTLLFQAMPFAVEEREGAVVSLWVAGKKGTFPVHALQWVDATETGILARLLPVALNERSPDMLEMRLHFQSRDPLPQAGTLQWKTPDGSCRCGWSFSHWPCEFVLRLEMVGTEKRPLRYFVPALRMLRQRLGKAGRAAFVSHSSFRPYPRYEGSPRGRLPVFTNVVIASPALHRCRLHFLGDRFALGTRVVDLLETAPKSEPDPDSSSSPSPPFTPDQPWVAEVVVAGLGTGGSLAALAAAREGAKVLAIESQPFAGGIATGGGIPMYYWGCEGGLQEEVDQHVRTLMPLFARREEWPHGFHPDAKRVALEELLHESGVRILWESQPVSVFRTDRRIEKVVVMTPTGRAVVEAPTWIDGTGDGDFGFMAGAAFSEGRVGDGLTQPYTQSCARFGIGAVSLCGMIYNVDTGRLDPTDCADWTRARLAGLFSLSASAFNAFQRPASVAPLLGVRESRRLDAEHQLTLDDLVERRRFRDAVGYTGAHYDNHSSDYEFESDAVFFYVACAGLFWTRTACEIPYRMLIPKGLDNLWIGCRAAGLTEEALHSVRMQRDIQRFGEVCGFAAALAVRHGTTNREVPYRLLRERLRRTGALEIRSPRGDFGASIGPSDMRYKPITAMSLRRDLIEALEKGNGEALWRVFRHGREMLLPQIRMALRSGHSDRSWHAAQLMAAWGEPCAEARLIAAVQHRESGSECRMDRVDPRKGSRGILPRWWQAVTLLRCCGGRDAIRALARLADSPDLPYRVRSATAFSIARLAERVACSKREREWLATALDALEGNPGEEDWSVAYACAVARRRLGLKDSVSVARFSKDPRGYVQRIFLNLPVMTGTSFANGVQRQSKGKPR